MAEQLEFFPVPNPCRGICRTDNRGYCMGCLRSRDERFNWMSFSDSQKRDIIRLCQQRRSRLQRQQKGVPDADPQQQTLF